MDTSKSLLYAEKVNDSIVVLHKGTTKDTVKIGTSRFQSATEKELLEVKLGFGVMLIPEGDGGYEVADVIDINTMEMRIPIMVLIGIILLLLFIGWITYVIDNY